MGIYDWEAKEKNQVASKSFFSVRYAAVLGNELFNIVEHNGNQVSLASVSRLLGSRNSCGLLVEQGGAEISSQQGGIRAV